MSADALITKEPNKYGGRLKYWGTSATADYWDSQWKQLETSVNYSRSINGHLPHQLRRTFLRWVQPGARVLEAGCGYAHFTVAVNALGYRAHGVDFAPDVVEYVKRRFPDMSIVIGDVRDLSTVDDGFYDAVYSPGVCEHFEEGPEDVLHEAVRVLAPGGFLFVSTPCFNGFRKSLANLGAFRGEARGDFYQYAFSRAEMRDDLRSMGLEVVQMHGSGSLKTLQDHIPFLAKLPLGSLRTPLAGGLDTLPFVGDWFGHVCMWVGRKR